MSDFGFTAIANVNFSETAIMAAIEGQKSKADFAMGTQVLIDSNYYCKWDTKTLINSSLINSSDDLTTIQWVTPYASRQYYLPAVRRDMNPNATWKWFETAKAGHLTEWVQTYETTMKGGHK